MKNKEIKKPKKKTEKKQDKAAARKSITRKTVKAAFKGFTPAAFARGCGLTRQGVIDGIASGRIKVNTSGLIMPDDNGRFLTQKMRLGIRQELLDRITDKKIISAIKSHFRKIISIASVKSEQAERQQIEIDELKQTLAPVELLRGLFVFIADFKKDINALKDNTIQNKISDMMKSGQDREREAVHYIRLELQKIIKKLHSELIEKIYADAAQAEKELEDYKKKIGKTEEEIISTEESFGRSSVNDISILIEQASQASMSLSIANDKLKSIQSVREQLLTLEKKQIIAPLQLLTYYFSFIEKMVASSYDRPFQIAPILKTYYMANDLNMAGDHLVRELSGVGDQTRKEVLTAIENDGYKLKNIPCVE